MKQLLSITILFSLTFLLTASSCKKQNTGPQLPSETKTGANTLGFKINGKVYTASGKSGLLSSEYVWGGGPYSDTSVIIGAENSIQKFSFLLVVRYSLLNGLNFTGEYPYEGFFMDESDGTIPIGPNVYNTNNNYKGIVNIKFTNGSLNPLQGSTIISGTFEMEAVNNQGKIIKLTDGRFDIGQ
jgi:hypothetical protein